MKMYLVKNGVARLPIGSVVAMDAAQYTGRAHNVDVVKSDKKSGGVVARVKGVVEFKAGERIGFQMLPKALAQVCEEIAEPSAVAA